MNNREKGKDGEKEAANFLLQRGYTIISMNYESRIGEIDCIACDKDETIVFIEVKAVKTLRFGNPIFKINRSKQNQIIKMARLYLAEHNINNRKCRFDAITIVGNKINHIKNAFMA